MRNVLAHGDFEIDTELAWDAIMRDVPGSKAQMQRLLRDLESP